MFLPCARMLGCMLVLAAVLGGAPARAASLAELKAAAGNAPRSADALFDWGVAALRSEHPDQAWEAYGRLMKLDPAFASRRAAQEEARLSGAPEDRDAHYRLAAAYYAAGKHAAAARTLQTLCERFPDEQWAWLYQGYLKLEGARLDEAKRCAEQTLKLAPGLGSARFLMAQIHYRQGAFQPAREALEGLTQSRMVSGR